jgi:predicted NBD/HSP70 family sugar kinase
MWLTSMSTKKGGRSGRLYTATPESVREVNRLILLGLLRRHQPISRADLSRRSGIFPSNVSRIVECLIEEGLLTEQRAKPSGRGKVPMLLRIRDDYFPVVGIYVQPSETTLAFAGFSGEIQKTWSIPTPSDPQVFCQEIRRMLGPIRNGMKLGARAIRHIGVGVPGFVDAARGVITCVTTLPAYSGYPLAKELERHTGIPVSIDNDCNLGALSELWRQQAHAEGAQSDFLFLSIGDYGVGAGLILRNMLYRGHDSCFAAEVGHIIVDSAGPQCTCGRTGCLETFISNAATWKRYRPRTPFHRRRFHELLQAADNQEPRAVAAIEETARYIALAASNLTTILNPAEIVLAGEIAEAFPLIHRAVDTLFLSPHARVNLRRSWSAGRCR